MRIGIHQKLWLAVLWIRIRIQWGPWIGIKEGKNDHRKEKIKKFQKAEGRRLLL
jgi:hypothetical protein